MGPFLLQAAAGFASAVLLLGTVIVLVGMFTRPEVAQATKMSHWAWPRLRTSLSLTGGQQQRPDWRASRPGGG